MSKNLWPVIYSSAPRSKPTAPYAFVSQEYPTYAMAQFYRPTRIQRKQRCEPESELYENITYPNSNSLAKRTDRLASDPNHEIDAELSGWIRGVDDAHRELVARSREKYA